MLKTLVEREQQFSDYKQTDQKSNMKTKRKVQVSENKNKGSRKTLQRNPWIKNNEGKIRVVVFFFPNKQTTLKEEGHKDNCCTYKQRERK